MSDEQRASTEEKEVNTTSKKKPKKSKKPVMSIQTYFKRYRQDVSKYVVSYVSVKYADILKSQDEWDSELKGKI